MRLEFEQYIQALDAYLKGMGEALALADKRLDLFPQAVISLAPLAHKSAVLHARAFPRLPF